MGQAAHSRELIQELQAITATKPPRPRVEEPSLAPVASDVAWGFGFGYEPANAEYR